MISLILNINNRWEELDIKDVDIVLHRAFSDLEDPSSIESAYTLNVQLPFTTTNVKVLGEIEQLDYERLTGSIEFDQRKKYKFKLLHEESILYEGDFVLDSIDICADASQNKFNVTLYDELYSVFKTMDYELSDPADTAEEVIEISASDNPYIDGKNNYNIDSLDVALSSNLVKKSFETNPQYADLLMNRSTVSLSGEYDFYAVDKTNLNASTESYIGFIPTYKKTYDEIMCLNSGGTDGQTSSWTDSIPLQDFNPSLPNSMPEFTMQTWKAWNCKPFIYYKNYIEFLMAEIFRATGYKVRLWDYDTTMQKVDRDFFEVSNPYWSNLILTGKYIDTSENADWEWVDTGTTSYTPTGSLVSYDISGSVSDSGLPTITAYDSTALRSWVTLDNYYNNYGDIIKTYNLKIDSSKLDPDNITRLTMKTTFWPMFLRNDGPETRTINNVRFLKYSYLLVKLTANFYDASNALIMTKSSSHPVCGEKCYERSYTWSHQFDTVDLKKAYWNGSGSTSIYNYATYAIPDDEASFDSSGKPQTYTIYGDSSSTMMIRRVWGSGSNDNKICMSGMKGGYDADFSITLTPSEVRTLKTGNVVRYQIIPEVYFDTSSGTHKLYHPESSFDGWCVLFNNHQYGLQTYPKGRITWKNLLGEDFNVLSGFTDFLKTFNLVCKPDYLNKKLNLFNRGEYFNKFFNTNGYLEGYKDQESGTVSSKDWHDYVEDWTEYVDYSDPINFTEITSEYKNIEYKYEDRDDYFNVDSRDNYNQNNHSVIYETPFTGNTETYNFLEGKYNSCISNLKDFNCYYFFDIQNGSLSTHYKIPKLYVDVDQNGDEIDSADFQLLFRGNHNYPYEIFCEGNNNNAAFIMDKTVWEFNNNKDVFIHPHLNTNYTNVAYSYPNIDYYYVEDDKINLYPSISTYSYDFFFKKSDGTYPSGTVYSSEFGWNGYSIYPSQNNENNVNTIYSLYHKKWNDLLYGEQNKIVEAKFHLPLEIYTNFDFNHLLLVDNNLYLVLSIEEYAFNNQMMKAKLLQLHNYDLLNQLDPTYNEDIFRVLPTRFYLSSAPTTADTYGFTVISSHPAQVVNNVDGKTPTEINPPSWYVDQELWPKQNLNNIVHYNISYKTNNYPSTQDTWHKTLYVSDSTTSTTNDEEYIEVTNVIGSSFDYPISVAPLNVTVPNASGTACTQTYIVTSPRCSINNPTVSSSGNQVVTNFTVTGNNPSTTNSGNYIVTVSYNSTTGTGGQLQTVTFTNIMGSSCTSNFVRDYAEFEHQTWINNGTNTIWEWDYTNIEELMENCVASEYTFTIRTNYDFMIDNWDQTLYDAGLDEFAFNSKCFQPILEDLSDGKQYYPGSPFYGLANTYYTLKFTYPRRGTAANDPNFSGYILVTCTDSSHHNAYAYQQLVIANQLNNIP